MNLQKKKKKMNVLNDKLFPSKILRETELLKTDFKASLFGRLSCFSEAAIRRCSSKYMFLKISQYSQENTCEYCEKVSQINPLNLVDACLGLTFYYHYILKLLRFPGISLPNSWGFLGFMIFILF